MLLVGGTTLSPRLGDIWVFEIQIALGGVALSLDDCTVYFTAKVSLDDADSAAALAASTGAGITHLATTGTVIAVFPPHTTSALLAGERLWWDVSIIQGGQPLTPAGLTGKLVPLPQVSQALS